MYFFDHDHFAENKLVENSVGRKTNYMSYNINNININYRSIHNKRYRTGDGVESLLHSIFIVLHSLTAVAAILAVWCRYLWIDLYKLMF